MLKRVGQKLQKTPAYAVGFFVSITIFSIVISTALLIWNFRGRELEHARVETVSIAHMFMEQTEQSFNSADILLISVQEKMLNAFGLQQELEGLGVQLLLNTRAAGSKQIKALFVVNAEGQIVNSSKNISSPPIFVTDRNYFKAFAKDGYKGTFIDSPVRTRIDNTWALHMSRELVDAKGHFKGVLVASIDIPNFEQLYNFMSLDFLRPIAIYLRDGTLIASIPHRENMIGSKVPEISSAEFANASEDVAMIHHLSGDGGHQVVAIGKLTKYPLVVSVINDDERALAAWRETSIPIGLGACAVCLFIFLVARYLIQELIRENTLTLDLRDATDRYHHTINSVMDAIVAVDAQQNILLFNPAAESMFGYTSQEMIGHHLSELIPDRFRSQHFKNVDGFKVGNTMSRSMSLKPQLEIFGKRKDGSEFPIESTISKTTIGDSVQLTAVLRDATQRRRDETELYKTNQQLRDLSVSLETVREEERARISRELHDDLGQQLTGLKLDMTWLANRIKEGREADPEKVTAMRHSLDAAVTSVRRISTELRPMVLDDLGFIDALKWHATELAKRSGLDIQLHIPEQETGLSDDVATALFRIVQESLNNIVKHANAQHVVIRLEHSDDKWVLSVQDDGQGFPDSQPSHGIGLVSMRERAIALGGEFSVFPNSSSGFTVRVEIPVEDSILQGAKHEL